MKTFLISDNNDTYLGMRLAGIDGIIVHEKEEVLIQLDKALSDPDIGIIIVTELIMDIAPQEILDIKMKRNYPLIVEIPDRHGTRRKEDRITRYIRESIGIKI